MLYIQKYSRANLKAVLGRNANIPIKTSLHVECGRGSLHSNGSEHADVTPCNKTSSLNAW